MQFTAGRRRFRLIPIVLAAAMLMVSGRVRAAEQETAPFAGYIKYVRYHVHYEVNADGTHVETWDTALKVLSPQGISQANQMSVSYSERLQSVKILYAYTLKNDGHRINVPPGNFQVQINKGKGKASPMFSDLQTLTVAYPEVAAGDTVALGYKLIQKKATFPGNFSFLQTFSKFIAYDDAQVAMSAPASLKIQVETRGVKGGEVASKDGRKNWLWTYRNERIAAPESGSVSSLDYGPLIVASTFKDYAALAHAYDLRAKPKAVPDARVKQLASEITRDAQTPREQAAALYQWVSTNIDYAGDFVGVGAVVPHDAATVLANRMGDCKDHATLYLALLAARGIAGTSVLINGANAYTLPEVPAIQAFNHVITYLPALKQYADTTSRFTPFGYLPMGDADKPVIYTSDFGGIQHTPPTNWKNCRAITTTVLTITSDGSARGETKITTSGAYASLSRAGMTYLAPNLMEQAVRTSLAANGYTGTGTVQREDPLKPLNVYRYSATYQLTDAINLPGPGAFSIRAPVSAAGGMREFLSGANDPKRTVNFSCMGVVATERYTIHLPKDVKVLAIPRDVHLSDKYATYIARYQRNGNTVTAVRELDDTKSGNVCTPQISTEFKPFARRALKDVRAQVLYQ
jgi:transglutaminase-like putative cysteine protease